jgi:nucleotidyltransferase/DNA polymerase involved in DNA repair
MLAYVSVPDFYAEIERRRDATLAGRPVLVGGDPRKRGTVQSATADARRGGVSDGMPILEALELCPQARALRTDMKRYREVDAHLRAWLRRATERVEPAGLGAAYLDLAGHSEPADELGQVVWQSVQDELGLPLRVGIAPLKFVAKLAAEVPAEAGVLWVRAAEIRAFLDPLPVARLPGVGPRTVARLADLGAISVADLVALGRETIERELGNHGLAALEYARGRDVSTFRAAPHPRSLSQESTLAAGELDRGVLEERLTELAEGLESALARERLAARRVVLKVRYVDETQPQTRSCTLNRAIVGATELHEQAVDLLTRTQAGSRPIRGLGLALQSLVRSRRDDRQLDLFGS